MLRFLTILALALTLSTPVAQAQNYYEPARGTALRADLMDAIRPHIEWTLGAPVEFVISDLRVSGDLAFASLWAQRPGGGQIDMANTPGGRQGMFVPGMDGGPSIQVLYRRSGRVWVAVHHEIAATDVWYSWAPLCAVWRPVIPDACNF